MNKEIVKVDYINLLISSDTIEDKINTIKQDIEACKVEVSNLRTYWFGESCYYFFDTFNNFYEKCMEILAENNSTNKFMKDTANAYKTLDKNGQ